MVKAINYFYFSSNKLTSSSVAKSPENGEPGGPGGPGGPLIDSPCNDQTNRNIVRLFHKIKHNIWRKTNGYIRNNEIIYGFS